MVTRRDVLKTGALCAVAAPAASYARIIGANDRVNCAIMGLNGRGYAHLSALSANRGAARVSHICDVDAHILAKFAVEAQKELGYAPEQAADCRKVLASPDVDAITIATPDHWHAPMAVLSLEAGKHVYVEKPSSHNPQEGELLVAAQHKYAKLVQVGDQQRSSPHTIKIIGQIHAGLIGRPYFANCWYVNDRKSMGFGKPAPVPAWLDWDLWQGPAPRSEYKDNIQPYNWHWLRRYGTGEALNNGTHEVDICRWALGVDYPDRVTASGGRYQFKDDWQFPDTMTTSFTYPEQMITWDGTSCSAMLVYNRGRGSVIHGTTGSVLIDRDGYIIYNAQGRKTDEFAVGTKSSTADLLSRDSMTDAHFANFLAGIRSGEKLNSPVEVANVCVTMLQLSNIAWFVNRELRLDTKSAHILDDPEAMQFWAREYQMGWEIRV